MGRNIVKNLKFKKHTGKFFDPEGFAEMLDESYRNTKRADGEMTKKSFSPSSLGYGHGTCPRYWYMAFSGAVFIDNNDAVAVANMAQGTQAHERLQNLIKTMPQWVAEEEEIINEYPPIRGFIDLIMKYDDETVIGEIKTAKQEVWDNFKDGDLPMKPEGATKTKMPCTYCPIKKQCYSKETPTGTVQIERFKVPTL